MRVTSLLLGSLLGFGIAANAAAVSTAAPADGMSAGTNAAAHASNNDHGSNSREGAASGDAMNVPHSANVSSSTSGNTRSSGSGSTMEDSPARFGSGSSDNSPDGSAHGASGLGWQSLLPGSIQ